MDLLNFQRFATPLPRGTVAAWRRTSLAMGLLAAACMVTACAPQEVGRKHAAISDGELDEESLAIGRVIFNRTGEKNEDGSWKFDGSCTAVLVGQRTVLTAAHCVRFSALEFVLLNADSSVGKRQATTSWTPHPDFDPNEPNLYDIAVVRLESVPTEPQAVTPFKVLRAKPQPLRKVRLVGLGETAHGEGDDGIRRTAINYIDDVEDIYFTFSESGAGEGNACRGDSGGPALATHEGEELVMGLTSWVTSYNPVIATTWNTRVDVFFDWVDEQAQGDVLWVDGEAPTVSIKSPADGAQLEVDAAVDVEVEAADNIDVTELELEIDGTIVDSASTASHVFEVTLAPGERTIVVTARDEEGNEAEVSITVQVGDDQQSDAGLADAGSDAGGDAGVSTDAGDNEREPEGCALTSPTAADPSSVWLLCMLALWAGARRRR